MNGLKTVGLIEDAHGHKGTVKVKPVKGAEKELADLKDVYLMDEDNNSTSEKVYEVRKYRRGRYLLKFCGLKWRKDIEEYKNFMLAV